LASHHVGVTVLCPSFFKTGIVDKSRSYGKVPRSAVIKLMEKEKVQADDVARLALEAADKGRLYAVPHINARLAWTLKRLAPGAVTDVLLPRARRAFL